MALPLAAFTAADQARIRFLYDFVHRIFDIIGASDRDSPETLRALSDFSSPSAVDDLFRNALALGPETAARNPDELVAKTIHDIRGGGLTPLIGRLQLAQRSNRTADDARALFFLARDHLKIMRNALLGLDDVQRAIDQQPRLHGTSLILEKWQSAILLEGDRKIRLEVDAHFQGYVSECCLEFGALDRIFYNLINNACRHTADETIRLTMLDLRQPGRDGRGENVRFVFDNTLDDDDLHRLAGRHLTELFHPGVSSTQSGLGLTVVADFVAAAYGLPSREQALEAGYVGARLVKDQFVVWLHWPIAHPVQNAGESG